jgi:hypothetical protein
VCRPTSASFDHPIGQKKQSLRYIEAKQPRGLDVDHQLVFGRVLNRQVGGPSPPQDQIDIRCGLPILIDGLDAVRQQAAIVGEEAIRVDGRQPVASRQLDNQFSMSDQEGIGRNDQAATGLARERDDACFNFSDVMNTGDSCLDCRP